MILRCSFGNKIFKCYNKKNKATGITCLTFKCKLAFPTFFNDIHKRVLILSIHQMVLYGCCLHETQNFLYYFCLLIQQCILWWDLEIVCLINFLTIHCTENDGLTSEPRNYNILRCYVAKTNCEVIKGTCHVGMIEQTMEIFKVTTELGQSISYIFEWQHPNWWRRNWFLCIIWSTVRENNSLRWIHYVSFVMFFCISGITDRSVFSKYGNKYILF